MILVSDEIEEQLRVVGAFHTSRSFCARFQFSVSLRLIFHDALIFISDRLFSADATPCTNIPAKETESWPAAV